ncbi:hypothetical protein AAFC00_000978 [Neodothiora populina]|uniref:Polyubiquitin binding protein n=1 Tax=Neodothiora populina TaxID=2781224 RepID=A0ABR3PNF9_9PEZI
MAQFQLSATLQGHEDDVRAVVFPSPKLVYSASRDGTVRQWTLTGTKPVTYEDTIAVQSSSFVNSLAFIPPSATYSEGLIVSAGKDTIIDVRPPGRAPSDNAERMLLGHANNICALDVAPNGTIVSGGWDAQARVWDVEKGECVAELKGHTAAVWGVLVFDENTIITACADKAIRVFTFAGKLLHTITGLPDVVRALCKIPDGHPSGAAFASAGNDQIIRFWMKDGLEVLQLHGHEAFIYALAILPNGDLASSSEDRTVRIWRGTECIQTITHPAISVWSLAVCQATGDIVTGASDKIVRIFTRDPERLAAPKLISQFTESVRASAIPQQTASGGQQIQKESLPGPEFVQQKSGTKEGQVQMIREDNGNITAHTWSTAAQQWINVGTVVDASASTGRKATHEGKEYDYVFDVDIKDGEPPLKLPFNLDQNPYDVAQKFIGNNELPVTYLDQVANFIITNTQGATLGTSATQSTQAPGADPWGTENRYRPGEAGAPQTQGDSRPRALPQTQYLSITTANLPAIRKKIPELNETVSPDVKLSGEELKNLETLIKQLQSSPKDPKPQEDQLNVVLKVATRWAPANRLPGLDLLRLCAVSPSFIQTTSSGDGTIVDTLMASGVVAVENDRPNNTMLAVRLLANLFVSEEGRLIADGCFEDIVSSASKFTSLLSNKGLSTAIATLYINYAVLLTAGASSDSSGIREQRAQAVLDGAVRLIKPAADSETVYRALVATGTLLSLGGSFRSSMASTKDIAGVLKGIEGSQLTKESRISGVVAEIKDQLK